jgi:hypothetical protein
MKLFDKYTLSPLIRASKYELNRAKYTNTGANKITPIISLIHSSNINNLKIFIQILNHNLYPFMNPFINPTFSNINVGNTILYGKEDIRTNKEAIEQTEIFKIS